MTDKVLYLEEISAPLSVVPAGTRIEMSRPKEAIDIGHKPMTDTAKPTAEQSNELLERANIIDEYQSVYNCTGLTPRQLLALYENSKSVMETNQVLAKRLKEVDEQREELATALEELAAAALDTIRPFYPQPHHKSLGLVVEQARAALAKCGKAGG